MDEELKRKAVAVCNRLKDAVHPDDSEVIDAVEAAVLAEFKDWADRLDPKQDDRHME